MAATAETLPRGGPDRAVLEAVGVATQCMQTSEAAEAAEAAEAVEKAEAEKTTAPITPTEAFSRL